MDFERFHQRIADRLAWVKGCVGVLKDHLDSLPQQLHSTMAEAMDGLTFESNLPCVGLVQVDQESPQGRLAATGFPDQTEGFAAVDREVNAIDGAHRRSRLAKERFAPPEVTHEPPRLEERRLFPRLRWRCRAEPLVPGGE